MLRKIPWEWVALYATLALFGVSSGVPLYSMWGINHLAFLPAGWWWLYGLVVAAVVALSVVRGSTPRLDGILDKISQRLFDGGIWPRIVLVGVLAIVFWLFKTPTHFLGDGYTIRSNYGLPGPFVGSPTAPLASLIVQGIQRLLGMDSRFGIQLSFRIASVLSGGICLINLLTICRYLTESPRHRLFAFVTLIFSGSLLLFFGYIEYYPLLWAGATTCVALSIRYFRTTSGFYPAILSGLVAALIDIEGVLLLPGVVVIVATRFKAVRSIVQRNYAVTIGLILATVLLAFLSVARDWSIELGHFTLPWFSPDSPAGTVISGRHLLDLVNILLLIIPGVLVLAAWSRSSQPRTLQDSSLLHAQALSLGALAFLLVANADLGPARDWDLLSLPVFMLSVLPLVLICTRVSIIPSRPFLAYCLVVVLMTTAFLSSNLYTPASESRAISLVQLYGNRNRGGWLILQKYFESKGDRATAEGLRTEIANTFPPEPPESDPRFLLEQREFVQAVRAGQMLLQHDRFNAETWAIVGSAFARQAKFDSAAVYFDVACRLSPYSIELKQSLAQCQAMAGDSAAARQTLDAVARLKQNK